MRYTGAYVTPHRTRWLDTVFPVGNMIGRPVCLPATRNYTKYKGKAVDVSWQVARSSNANNIPVTL